MTDNNELPPLLTLDEFKHWLDANRTFPVSYVFHEIVHHYRAALAQRQGAMDELHKAVAEILGHDPETWPDHGSVPLAIAVTVKRLHDKTQRQGKPVAWMWRPSKVFPGARVTDDKEEAMKAIGSGYDVMPLYTAPATAEQPAESPDLMAAYRRMRQQREAHEIHTGKDYPAEQPAEPNREPNNEEVICPACTHQFRAIPVQVQRLLLDAGIEPPFLAATAPAPVAEAQITDAEIDGPLAVTEAEIDLILMYEGWEDMGNDDTLEDVSRYYMYRIAPANKRGLT